jgi:glucan-binding YG repeat protein
MDKGEWIIENGQLEWTIENGQGRMDKGEWTRENGQGRMDN